MRKAHPAAAIEANSPEYLTFWQKADTKTLENTLGKLNRARRGPIHVPLGLKFRFVHTSEPASRPNTAPKLTEKREAQNTVKLPLLVVSEEEVDMKEQQQQQQRRQRYCQSYRPLNQTNESQRALLAFQCTFTCPTWARNEVAAYP